MGERSGSYGQLETSNKLCKWTKLDLNPCQQNKLPGLWSVHNRISQKLRDVATIENVSHIDAGLVYHFICPFWFMHVWNFEIKNGIKASRQKERIFYGQADRKGGGGSPLSPERKKMWNFLSFFHWNLELKTHFISLWGVPKMLFCALCVFDLQLSDHFVTEQQQSVRKYWGL